MVDAGANSAESTDYPDYAGSVAKDVVSGAADRGILVCSTGVGMSIAANKVNGVRAAIAFNPGRGEPLAGSVGFRAPYARTRIVSLQDPERLRDCPKLTSGLVMVQGPQVFPGYVDPQHAAPGTRLAIDARGSTLPAVVVPLPFYKRTK